VVNPLRIALTGGIASGKTAAANEFAALGADVFDTDQIARDVVEPGSPTLDRVIAAFGADILDETGRMDRKRMRARVFADPTQRQKLESILHPAIRAELAQRAANARGPYQIHVIPLLAESGGARRYDRAAVVDCPADLQLTRLIQRDGSDEMLARQILAAQATREQRLAMADDVLTNTGSLDDLRSQVRALHERYLQLAAAASR